MPNLPVILTSDEWDRLIEILDTQHNQHPDSAYLVAKLHIQLNPSPTDESHKIPFSPTFSRPRTNDEIDAVVTSSFRKE